MLQRLTTLATQSANGTYNSVARGNLQKEVNALLSEINRIANNTDFNGIKPIESGSTGDTMTFQIGPSSAETIEVERGSMTASSLGINSISVTTLSGGNEAIDTVKAAIDSVSEHRAKLGAAQNRLEHTINNLKVTSENITAAESRIRDTDMADEITAFTKNNILLQASQSMLAQSNSVPQSVLSLLG